MRCDCLSVCVLGRTFEQNVNRFFGDPKCTDQNDDPNDTTQNRVNGQPICPVNDNAPDDDSDRGERISNDVEYGTTAR